jgi:adenylate kinase|tara:strand:+ start:204 stop:803 length:600 start_codon:yes stop_codon:yes gene_type:complete
MTITTNPYMMSGTCAHRIAITGTPGSGKTSVAEFGLTNSNRDWPLSIISDKELAEKNGFLGKIDSNDGAQPIDVERLVTTLSEQWAQSPEDDTLIDGHLSHLLPVDAIVIIRCNPEVLQVRMQDRGWSKSKIDENAEWELLGAAWNDEHEWGNTPVLELDSTGTSVDSLFSQIETWMRDGFKHESPEQRIDWITVLHGE